MTHDLRFWRLTRPENAVLADWDKSVDWEGPFTCPITEDHRAAGPRIGILRVVLNSARIDDFVWTHSGECMIRDHVLRAFRHAGFTGFDVARVEITKMRRRPRAKEHDTIEEEPPRLWELVVTGWAGEAAPESGIRMTYYCEGCGHTRYSNPRHPEHLLDPAQWDGSDFFLIWPIGFIFITDRVAQFLRDKRYKGWRVVRPDEIDFAAGGRGFGGYWPVPGRKVRGPEAFPKVRIRRFRTKGMKL